MLKVGTVNETYLSKDSNEGMFFNGKYKWDGMSTLHRVIYPWSLIHCPFPNTHRNKAHAISVEDAGLPHNHIGDPDTLAQPAHTTPSFQSKATPLPPPENSPQMYLSMAASLFQAVYGTVDLISTLLRCISGSGVSRPDVIAVVCWSTSCLRHLRSASTVKQGAVHLFFVSDMSVVHIQISVPGACCSFCNLYRVVLGVACTVGSVDLPAVSPRIVPEVVMVGSFWLLLKNFLGLLCRQDRTSIFGKVVERIRWWL